MIKVDFDYWMNLQNSNSERFNHERERLISEFIKSVPKRRQFVLTGLQAKINRVVRVSGSPMNACVTISKMMWNSFDELTQEFIKCQK